MSGLLLRAALVLSLLLVLPLWLTQPAPAQTASLSLADGCAAPCFMGLRPGTTILSDAMHILEAHPWVERVQLGEFRTEVRPWYGSGALSWQWSAAVPDEIDGRFPGQLTFVQRYDVTLVDSLRIHTRLRTPLVEAALGAPRGGSIAWEVDSALRYRVLFSSEPDRQVIGVTTLMPCPVNLLSYWFSEAELVLTAWVDMYGGPYQPPTAAARLC
jgi:hypothetical protein